MHVKTDWWMTLNVNHFMVRLDRTIVSPKLILTGLFGLMVWSNRTMTKKEGRHSIAPLY
jgi:hypothetical protein